LVWGKRLATNNGKKEADGFWQMLQNLTIYFDPYSSVQLLPGLSERLNIRDNSDPSFCHPTEATKILEKRKE
jgi:hypothetical protein